jgi:hypothetical protein
MSIRGDSTTHRIHTPVQRVCSYCNPWQVHLKFLLAIALSSNVTNDVLACCKIIRCCGLYERSLKLHVRIDSLGQAGTSAKRKGDMKKLTIGKASRLKETRVDDWVEEEPGFDSGDDRDALDEFRGNR